MNSLVGRTVGRGLRLASAVFAVALWTLTLAAPAQAEESHAGGAEVAAEGHAGEPEGGEHAAGEHGEGHAPSLEAGKLALQFLNFGVLIFILVKFGGGAINKALAARHHQIKTDIASAAQVRTQAEAKLAKQEARLASLENEIAELRRGLKAEAEAEKTRLVGAAEERVRRIQAETQFLLEQQVREAETSLRREAAETGLRAAEELLRSSMGPSDQQRLLDTFVADVAQPGRTT